TCAFAKLAKSTKVEEVSIAEYASAKEYYDYLLRFTQINKNGYQQFNQNQFAQLLNLIKTPEDVQEVKQAYYNFVGNKEKIINKQIDQFIRKAMQVNKSELLHEILYNHNFLMYYPTTSLLYELTQHYQSTQNNDAITDLAKIFSCTYFLKIDSQILDTLSSYAVQQKLNQVIFYVARAALIRDLVSINENTINNILVGFARSLQEPSEDQKIEKNINKFLGFIKKCYVGHNCINGKAYLHLAKKEIDECFIELANYNLIQNTNAINIIQYDNIMEEFLNVLENQLKENPNEKHIQRLEKVYKDIKIKLGDQAIQKEAQEKFEQIISSKQQ
ncbi:hypothetical protein IMG5_068450, partial [Ichthyophthirius multifiliis]